MKLFLSIKRLSFKHKNNKFTYYLVNYLRMLTPAFLYRWQLKSWLTLLDKTDKASIQQRVDYYNKLSGQPVPLNDPILLTSALA